MTLRLLALLLLLGSTTAAIAETLSCPTLATAVQVGNCPTEDELKYTFNGYCSDKARMYDKDNDACSDFQIYRRLKNKVAWEAGGGMFSAYLSCDLSASSIKSAEPESMTMRRQGKVALLVCRYGDNIEFTHRTRAECSVEGDGSCKPQSSSCRASCN